MRLTLNELRSVIKHTLREIASDELTVADVVRIIKKLIDKDWDGDVADDLADKLINFAVSHGHDRAKAIEQVHDLFDVIDEANSRNFDLKSLKSSLNYDEINVEHVRTAARRAERLAFEKLSKLWEEIS